jgi:hypothetical protein
MVELLQFTDLTSVRQTCLQLQDEVRTYLYKYRVERATIFCALPHVRTTMVCEIAKWIFILRNKLKIQEGTYWGTATGINMPALDEPIQHFQALCTKLKLPPAVIETGTTNSNFPRRFRTPPTRQRQPSAKDPDGPHRAGLDPNPDVT